MDGRGPLHRQLHRAIREAVLERRLACGTRLPATRTLADELGISRTVVVRAYERLRADGVLEARVGSGTWVREGAAGGLPASSPPAAGTPPRLSAWAQAAATLWHPVPAVSPPPYDFRYGRVDPSAFPRHEWRRSLRRAIRHQSVEYAPPEGSEALRTALANHLGHSRGVRCSADQIVIVTGSQQALDLTARVLLDPGDTVVLEEPQYQGARHTFVAAGARLSTRRVDAEGIVLEDEIEPANRAGGVSPAATSLPAPPRLAYVTPSHQFPAGGVLSLPRRLALLAWARRTGAWILEDDYDAEFRYDLPPVEAVHALDGEGRVVYAGTFSKVLFPSLRLGYLVLPPSLVAPFRTAKWLVDRHSPTLQQDALGWFISEGAYDRHLRRTRIAYSRRREALLEALETELGDRVQVVGTKAGVHVLVWLYGVPPERLGTVCEAALARGVGVYPATPYYAEAPPAAGLLLGYAALDEARIRVGVRRFREALDEAG
jgi:GntR family transcriptional regulator/MocR family aminotransferase